MSNNKYCKCTKDQEEIVVNLRSSIEWNEKRSEEHYYYKMKNAKYNCLHLNESMTGQIAGPLFIGWVQIHVARVFHKLVK